MHTAPDLYDQARLEAARLRREAVADFWRGAASAAEQGQRLARQLARQLARAQALRRTAP